MKKYNQDYPLLSEVIYKNLKNITKEILRSLSGREKLYLENPSKIHFSNHCTEKKLLSVKDDFLTDNENITYCEPCYNELLIKNYSFEYYLLREYIKGITEFLDVLNHLSLNVEDLNDIRDNQDFIEEFQGILYNLVDFFRTNSPLIANELDNILKLSNKIIKDVIVRDNTVEEIKSLTLENLFKDYYSINYLKDYKYNYPAFKVETEANNLKVNKFIKPESRNKVISILLHDWLKYKDIDSYEDIVERVIYTSIQGSEMSDIRINEFKKEIINLFYLFEKDFEHLRNSKDMVVVGFYAKIHPEDFIFEYSKEIYGLIKDEDKIILKLPLQIALYYNESFKFESPKYLTYQIVTEEIKNYDEIIKLWEPLSDSVFHNINEVIKTAKLI